MGTNKWYHRLYNDYCLRQVLANRELYTDGSEISNEKPLFVTGFFRSGTSLTTHLINILGMDLGPENHLLLAKNARAVLNPDGFFENYLFMDASLMAFSKLNSWGHLPPSSEKAAQLNFDQKDREQFAEYSLCGVHDDRISNKDKMDALKNFDVLSLNCYLEKKFKYPYAIKNPHFSIFPAFLLKKWPQAKFLVCFREPSSAISSAANITPLLDEKVYLRYYADLINLPADKVLFFSHAKLMESPENSLKALSDALHLNANKIPEALSILKPSLHRHKSKQEPKDSKVKELYELMLGKAINK